MLTKFKDSNDMNTLASDAIHSYLKDGYRIDAKESVIDRDKDKDCTFKAVLKKDVDGIECKTVITLFETGKDDSNKTCTYHKVETVGDTQWSEESRTYSCSKKDAHDLNSYANVVSQLADRDDRKVWDDDNWLENHRRRMKRIADKYGFGWYWFGDDEDSDNKTKDDDNDWLARHRKLRKCLKLVSDPDTHDYRWVWVDDNDKKTSTDNKSDTDKKDTKWRSALDFHSPTLAYQRLDDYIKLNNDKSDNDDKDNHIKVDAKDSEADIYNKIVNKRYKDNKAEEDKLDDVVSKIKVESATNKTDNSIKDTKQDDGDELEDSLIKLVRYIFGK